MNTLALSIASLSTEMATEKTLTDVSLAVLKKQMTQDENSNQQLIRMMERSVNPNLGANIDVKL